MSARLLASLALVPLLTVGGDAAPRSELSSSSATATQMMRFALNDEHDGIQSLAFSPDGRTLATGTHYGVILWDRTSGNQLAVARSHGEEDLGRCSSLVFSPGGKRLATVHDVWMDGPRLYVRVWDIGGDRQLRAFREFKAEGGRGSNLWPVGFSPDGKKIVTGEPHGAVIVWDVETGREDIHFHGGVAADFSPDGEALITVTNTGAVHRWAAGSYRWLTQGSDARRTDMILAKQVIFAADGRRVAVCDGYSALVKDTLTGRTISRIGGTDDISSLAFSPNGRILAVGHASGISFFDVSTGREQAFLAGTWEGTFSADGRHFASSNGSTVEVDELSMVLARGGMAPPPSGTSPPNAGLEAELIVKQDTYLLDLSGMTATAFAETAQSESVSSPKVDLVFRLKNTGDKAIKVQRHWPDLDWPYFHLEGPGALNIPLGGMSTGVGVRNRPNR